MNSEIWGIFAIAVSGPLALFLCGQVLIYLSGARKIQQRKPKKMVVYCDPRSPTSRTVLLLLSEKKCTFSVACVNLEKGHQKLASHKRLQPFGKVPVLKTERGDLYETEAILRYCSEVVKGPTYAPEDPWERASMDRVISMFSSYFSPHFQPIFREQVMKPKQKQTPDADVVKEAMGKLGEFFGVLETEMTKKKGFFLSGMRYSMADMCYMPAFFGLEDAGKLKELLKDRPKLSKWWEFVQKREAWDKTLSYSSRFFGPAGGGKRKKAQKKTK